MNLFDNIKKHIEKEDLESALLQLKIYAGHYKNIEIIEWCECELYGYKKESIIPEYRKIDSNDLLIECKKKNIIKKTISIPEILNLIDIDDEEIHKKVLKFIEIECKEKKNLMYGLNKISYYSDYGIASTRLTKIIKHFRIEDGDLFIIPNFAQFILKSDINLCERLKNDIKLKIMYYANILKENNKKFNIKHKNYLRWIMFICLPIAWILDVLNNFQGTFLTWSWPKTIFLYMLHIFQS